MSRLLVITELFLPTKGGTAVWFAEVYRRLGERDIHIVTADVDGADVYDAQHPNTVHRLDLRRIPWLRPESLGMYIKLFVKAMSLAVCHRFDGIHAGRALPEGLVAWLVARLTGRPVVVYAHGEELTTWGAGLKFRAMRFALRHADHVVANSDFTRGELRKLDVNLERITLINPGVDVQRFRPGLWTGQLRKQLGLGASEKLVLSVGRLSRRKGFDVVERSIPMLATQGIAIHYALIGTGEDEAYLKALAWELGVSSRVHLLGHVGSDDLPRWYGACDVFAMPNREIDGDTEGFGMVFIEAAACGKPTVAGIAGGTGAAVVDGETGLRVDGTSIDAVTGALKALLEDSALAARLGEAGQQRATRQFSWESVAAQTRLLVQERVGQ